MLCALCSVHVASVLCALFSVLGSLYADLVWILGFWFDVFLTLFVCLRAVLDGRKQLPFSGAGLQAGSHALIFEALGSASTSDDDE